MARIGIVIAYFFSSCGIGCLLAYPIHLVSDFEFERIVSRGILLTAVLLLYPTCKLLHINNLELLGFAATAKTKPIIKSWLLGVGMLLPLTIFFLICGYRFWEPLTTAGYLSPIMIIMGAILSGLIIALIEETLFRGLLQTELSNVLNAVLAILLVNFIYASAHFLQAPDSHSMQSIHWYSGFTLFFASFSALGQPLLIWDSWLALFTAGIFLSAVRVRSNNLIWCIGIHAGWVAHIKVIKAFTDRNSDAPCNFLVGQYDKFIGELSTIWIVLLLMIWFSYKQLRSSTR